MQILKDANLRDKKVLVRVDINSDVKDGKIIPSERFADALETITFLKKKKAKVVVLAHQGNKGKDDFMSLKQHAKVLNKGTKVSFIDDIVGKKALTKIKSLKSGQALLLENVRFLDDEMFPEKHSNELIKLVPLFDYYVNDAFPVCHRDQASVTLLPKHLPSYAGLSLEREVNALKNVSVADSLFILGGGKPEDNLKLIKKRQNKTLACGFFGQLILIARGKNLGYQNDFLRRAALVKTPHEQFLRELDSHTSKVIVPSDFAVNYSGERKEFALWEFPQNYEIEDIGKETLKLYIEEIKKAKAIYMKGPAGLTHDPLYAKGTIEILKAIANNKKAFSLIGGGHLSDAIKKYKIPKSGFDHISLSGGALLNFVAGEELPGLKALGFYNAN